MALEAAVIAVCVSGGALEFERLLELSAPGTGPESGRNLETVVGNRDYFSVIQRNGSRQVIIRTSLRTCRRSGCERSCRDLHLCRFHLLGQCNRRKCHYGHSLVAEHNSRVLRERSLHGLNIDQLRILLLQSDSYLLPQVCVSYNQGSGDYGDCADKEDCDKLHICENYLRGTCDGSGCNKSCHDFFEPHPMKTLKAKGVSSQVIGSLLVIYGNLLALKDHYIARVKTGARRRVDNRSKDKARVPESLQKNAENTICLSFVKGYCKFGDQCWRIHFEMPYRWQVEVDQVWEDLPDNEAIEQDFCDPAKIHSAGTEPVCFDTMVQGLHKVRRLSTESSVLEPTFVLTTKWNWYWENEYKKWILYASIKEMHRLSSITCDDLEQKYLQFLKNSCSDVVTFNAGRQFYKLSFREMKQTNEMTGTERLVRRRPQFLSSIEVQRARSRRGAPSSSHKGVPGYWDKTAIPDAGFQRVILSPPDKDYIRVQEHFHKTLQSFKILNIERVQNKELWEDFQTKRERMKKANKDKKYAEGERFLFHGTRSTLIKAICLQNFDMRVSGANGTVYGQGSYFARDASYSHDYTDEYGEKYMFVCRVLVGHYTRGAPDYRRPPPKDSSGTLYDSCVNNVKEPTIYVVFDKAQVYPEFLVTYKESADVNIFQPSGYTLSQSSTPSTDNTALAVTSQRSAFPGSPYPPAAATDPSMKSDDCQMSAPETSLSGYSNQSESAQIQNSAVLLDFWNPVIPISLDSRVSDSEADLVDQFTERASPTTTTAVVSAPNLSARSSNVKGSSFSNSVHSVRAKTQIATLPSQTADITGANATSLLEDSKKKSVNLISSPPNLSFLEEDSLDDFTVVKLLPAKPKPAAVDHSASGSFKESNFSVLYKSGSLQSAPSQSNSPSSLSLVSDMGVPPSVSRSPPPKPKLQQKSNPDCTLQ